jgi:hypothetical protein
MRKLPVLPDVLFRRLSGSTANGAPTRDVIAPAFDADEKVFGKRLGLLSRIVGCSHRDLSRPFVEEGVGYKTCLSCGARSPFDPVTFKSDGKFYMAPVKRV